MKPILQFLFVLLTCYAGAQSFSWADQFGGTLSDRITSITTDANGNIYVTGQFEGTMDADPGPGTFNLTSAGGSDTFIAKLNPDGALIWVRQIGGSTTFGGEGGNGIAVDASGNIYVTGTFLGTVDFDLGSGEFIMVSTPPLESQYCVPWADIFILKLTAEGDFVWAKQIGGNGQDEVASIVVSSAEEVFVVGEYVTENYPYPPVDMDPGVGTFYLNAPSGSAAFMLKLDADGGFMWAKQWHSTGVSAGGCGLRDALVHPFSLSLDGNGNVFCTGDFGARVDFDPDEGVYSILPNSNAAFVLKLNGNGAFQWVRVLSNSGAHAYGKDVVVGVNGNIFSVGRFDGTVDFDPGSGTKNLKAPGGSPGIGPSDAYVWILNSLGNYVWAGQLGGNADDAATSVDLDGSGNVYVTGTFTGTADFNPASAKNTLKSAGSVDVFITKLTGAGGYVWAGRLGGTLYDYPHALDIDGSSSIITAGWFEGTADFNPGSGTYSLTSYGEEDAFLHKMTQSGGGNLARPWPDDEEVIEANVFPNPTTHVLNVEFAQFAEDVGLQVYDLHGNLMLEKFHVTGRSAAIDVSLFPAGMYLVRILEEVKPMVLPFIKTE